MYAVSKHRDGTAVPLYQPLKAAGGDKQIHLWFAYAKKEYGGCIRFKTPVLLAAIKRIPGLLYGPMRYTSREEINAKELRALPPEELPFIKRRPYEAEQEYRILWTGGPDETPPAIPVTGLVDRVTLAPAMTESFSHALKEMLETRYAEKYGLQIQRSRLLNSPGWISLLSKLD